VDESFYGNWTTGSTAIATVSYYGTHTGQAVGATTSYTSGYLLHPTPRTCSNVLRSPQGPDNVAPRIDSIDPNTVTVGTTVPSVTINGTGFGSSLPTVNLPQGVTVAGGMSSSNGKIILNSVVVSATASISPNSITVTVKAPDGSSQTSNQGAFMLDGPFS